MATETPWHAAFPAPRIAEPPSLTREEVLHKLRSDTLPDFVIVDLRRNDFEGGTIRGAVNLPAQTLYPSIPTLYALFKAAGGSGDLGNPDSDPRCQGSRSSRGARAAGWFADYIQEKGDNEMQSVTLQGGIKGWVAAGDSFTELMEGYDAEHWAKTI
ncbi:Rhodanese-like domain-containing protein [Xylariaceae sp. FL1272]|nr:Rhodanese-like domain-containing protein [Xylariaceae sp. FL1272]